MLRSRATWREAVSGQCASCIAEAWQDDGNTRLRHTDDLAVLAIHQNICRRSWVRQCLLIGMSPHTILRLNKALHHHAYMLKHTHLPTLRAAETKMEVYKP